MFVSTTFLFCAFTTANLLVSSADANSGDFVVTKTAALHGVTQTHLGKTVKAYLGVPYAEPPRGSPALLEARASQAEGPDGPGHRVPAPVHAAERRSARPTLVSG
ncbi:hypothetical protein MTO96_008724 [Rhipicephalus appendiculatus]